MKRFAVAVLVVTLVLACTLAYLIVTPSEITPVAWTSRPAPGYVGAHVQNTRLASASIISLGADVAPEHIVAGRDGRLYASVAGGRILRMHADASSPELFATTGGRVLGLDFDAAGNLVAADAYRGLLSITPAGVVSVLADSAEGAPIGYADAVVVAASGKIYFSDATTRFPLTRFGGREGTEGAALMDIVEHSSTGRILEYDPATRRVRVVARGLCFANGVAMSSDQRALLVSETGGYRVWRIDVTANAVDVRSPSTQASVLLDNLPGLPDNLMRGRNGRYWLGLPEPRAPFLDDFAGRPWVRKVALRLPAAIRPAGTPYGHVIAFTEDGRVVEDLQDPSGAFPKVTGLTETADRWYIQTLNHRGLAWLPAKP